eukprot:12332-Heterococcus_DN1.PRE.4
MSRKLDPPQLVVLQRLGMEASMEECFKSYCDLTPFVERCFTSWQLFAAQHMCQPLTFNQHNYEVLLQQHDATRQELLGQKQRAAKLQRQVELLGEHVQQQQQQQQDNDVAQAAVSTAVQALQASSFQDEELAAGAAELTMTQAALCTAQTTLAAAEQGHAATVQQQQHALQAQQHEQQLERATAAESVTSERAQLTAALAAQTRRVLELGTATLSLQHVASVSEVMHSTSYCKQLHLYFVCIAGTAA